ncbi:SURF1 family protein [Tersicoccus sp. Bi-70]|uniref:SURF1 family cytochrome oxidase biogenesis protein n=1 Tax=Tersicoccus sp. Bi-70 TaxID=1897634 RepID=UPI000977B677|nr:SURF1 family protein [Tersicoccus sp. Bi-70]OMH33239.1 cytochrome oxidase biogenesis protein Surf1, facilitates heme A insertion [Tersicoccus sp. Bi-70]
MREYRFLFSPQWLGWFGLAVLFAIVCAFLGHWQLDRRTETVAAIDTIEQNYDHTPLPFAQAAGQFRQFDSAREWTPVQMTGRYLADQTRVVRNRPLNGLPGFEVLVPFRTTDGPIVVIDRGWLPLGSNGDPSAVPAPPSGTVDVVARLKHAEGPLDRGAPAGQLASIDLTTYAAQVDGALGAPLATGAYGALDEEKPAPATSPTAFPRPSLDEGPHLSYAMQWFAFGLLGFVGLGYAARQQAWVNRNGGLDDDEDIPAHLRSGAIRKRPRRRTRTTAEDEEDALLDAAGWR